LSYPCWPCATYNLRWLHAAHLTFRSRRTASLPLNSSVSQHAHTRLYCLSHRLFTDTCIALQRSESKAHNRAKGRMGACLGTTTQDQLGFGAAGLFFCQLAHHLCRNIRLRFSFSVLQRRACPHSLRNNMERCGPSSRRAKHQGLGDSARARHTSRISQLFRLARF